MFLCSSETVSPVPKSEGPGPPSEILILLVGTISGEWRQRRPFSRDGRAAECGGLISRYRVKPIKGSNPFLSAKGLAYPADQCLICQPFGVLRFPGS